MSPGKNRCRAGSKAEPFSCTSPEATGSRPELTPAGTAHHNTPNTPERTYSRQGSPSQISWKRPSREGSRRRRASAMAATATMMMPGLRGRSCSGACRRCPAYRRRCCPAWTRPRRSAPGGTGPCGARRTSHPVFPWRREGEKESERDGQLGQLIGWFGAFRRSLVIE